MAKQSKPEVSEDPTVSEPTAPDTTEPEAQETVAQEEVDTNGAGEGREPQIASEPEKSFEERTGVGTPPWLNPDGTQNTGE